ncbi:hypothetical protein CONCODRAFT_79737 [Conidiobolus coronatus NRRL 28638]|uniref:IMS import disulfide relay-system CHCH-CHCH-like Cx9C domain-containing protein n=1 Tax=Conidiobolus coronatus (strain ATCC 28846 / CBS 209.66 / NRRL 28638) TaxID=796925 RepID=A0A137P056_CONC2|nr:hypothetical protein CONCODRAFT_79737 [Conidiobolus coronatus NRRL 28638]|eukprot:KXN68470.1 hypothetical protein CONCODRAFT_79737 [Conidiobolus coronatus NRRL 28638]
MDDTFQQVQQKCAEQLKALGECIEKNQSDYNVKCVAQRQAVTTCAENNVPILKHIKTTCFDIINKYEACLDKNSQNPQICMPELKQLSECSDSARKSFLG